MDFRINYNITNEISNNLLKQVDDLDITLKRILFLIDELNTCWKGIDYDDFSSNSKTYIKNVNFNVEELRFLGKFIRMVSKEYSDNDIEWMKKLKEIGAVNEWNME